MAAIQDFMIYNVVRDRGGTATKAQIVEALGGGDEVGKVVEEKLRMMARFGLVVVEGNTVKMP
jgi:hypothetical protein